MHNTVDVPQAGLPLAVPDDRVLKYSILCIDMFDMESLVRLSNNLLHYSGDNCTVGMFLLRLRLTILVLLYMCYSNDIYGNHV